MTLQSKIFKDRLVNLIVDRGLGTINYDTLIKSIAGTMGVVPVDSGIKFNDGSEVEWPELMEELGL